MSGAAFFEDTIFSDVNTPVLRPLAEQMRVSLLLNAEGKLWLVHDKSFSDILMWAEYDIDAASLLLVFKDGKIQDTGVEIPANIRKYIRGTRQLFTIQMQDDAHVDSYVLPLLARETGYYKA